MFKFSCIGVEISHSKRQSSPNIGINNDSSISTQYGIAIHPDFLVKKVYQQNNRPKIFVRQRSVDSFSFVPPANVYCSYSGISATSSNNNLNKKTIKNTNNNTNNYCYSKGNKLVRGFEPSSYSYESLSPATSVEEVDESIEETDTSTSNTLSSSNNQKSDSSSNIVNDGLKLNYADIITTTSEYAKSLNRSGSPLNVDTTENCSNSSSRKSSRGAKSAPNSQIKSANPETTTCLIDRDQFIKESGILGPAEIMGSAISGLFRKQSKGIPMHQDPADKEQVRITFHPILTRLL